MRLIHMITYVVICILQFPYSSSLIVNECMDDSKVDSNKKHAENADTQTDTQTNTSENITPPRFCGGVIIVTH